MHQPVGQEIRAQPDVRFGWKAAITKTGTTATRVSGWPVIKMLNGVCSVRRWPLMFLTMAAATLAAPQLDNWQMGGGQSWINPPGISQCRQEHFTCAAIA